ncbi:MAG TPA: DICT sensory domain-containing protein [Coleofasciculaceae cyanobacterium]
MNLPSSPDVSLYQLAVETLAPAQSFSVSPTTLKSLVGSLIDVLIEEKIPATLWVKLPPTEGWQAELKRYQRMADVPQTIYLCTCFGERLAEGTHRVGQTANVKRESSCLPLQLAAGSQLKREYFLIVFCEQFSALIVAYPPELARAPISDQSQPLLAICSFERQVIQRVLEGIRGVIAVADTTSKELLERWETLFPLPCAFDEKALLTQLLATQVQRTEEILQQATPSVSDDNLRNKDELLRRVVQELRTPLTNMKTALKLLDSPQLKPAQRQRYMQLLNTQCDRQNSLITGLLELVQLDSEPQPTVMPSVQLASIVPGVVSTYQPIAQEKGIQLGYTVPTELPCVSCLETWLRQIVINLLHNSLKFTPTGGQVKVQATLQGEYVQLAISDTGVGITAGEIPKIFDSFYRGRSTTGEDMGAGLGLTIVQQLLLRCSGSISVTSRLGEGSNFKVLLPVASPTATEDNF